MSVIEDLMIEKEEAKIEQDKDRIIFSTIVNEYQKDNPGDDSIFDSFKQEADLRRIVSSESRWERVENGFVTRTNFAYDEKNKEITFDSYYIAKLGGKYVPDGSKVSIEYFNKHLGDFAALAKVEDIISRYQAKYEEPVSANLNSYDKRKRLLNRSMTDIVATNNRHTNMYLNLYGDIGKRLLIKWLNRLNREDIDLDTLLIEFKTDISSAKLYLDTPDNKEYQWSKACHMELDFALIRVLERYSPRGKYFHSMYNQSIEKQRTV